MQMNQEAVKRIATYLGLTFALVWLLGLGAFSADGLPASETLASFLATNATIETIPTGSVPGQR